MQHRGGSHGTSQKHQGRDVAEHLSLSEFRGVAPREKLDVLRSREFRTFSIGEHPSSAKRAFEPPVAECRCSETEFASFGGGERERQIFGEGRERTRHSSMLWRRSCQAEPKAERVDNTPRVARARRLVTNGCGTSCRASRENRTGPPPRLHQVTFQVA